MNVNSTSLIIAGRSKSGRRSSCAGFSLIDILFAMLIASIGVAGLMRYQQSLLFQFYYAAESRQAWKLAGQLLDIYPARLPDELDSWHYFIEADGAFNGCITVKATVRSPKRYEAMMERLICLST